MLHSRRQLVPDHVDFAVLRNLSEARRSPAGLGVHVQRFEHRGLSLRLSARGIPRHVAKRGHLFGSEKLPQIGPALGALLGTNLHQPVPVLDDREFVAVLDRSRNGRLQRQFLPQVQRARTDVRFAERGDGARLIGTGNQERRGKTQRKKKYSASQCHERQVLLLVYQ